MIILVFATEGGNIFLGGPEVRQISAKIANVVFQHNGSSQTKELGNHFRRSLREVEVRKVSEIT